ncbi:hypothetical protein FAF44_03235 [Nonomuraea sp. MG754425]|uniref:hypothetical protein n=1 Tax=Nonomuraea sp. MG754425 TaxID=2570319 RepID=UPI001F192944|nr:hypothetical protein [Nonomuraea sp. MG754425]MCF6467428.1 hypothetical protein [Nonomuraea sp. MG754425]
MSARLASPFKQKPADSDADTSPVAPPAATVDDTTQPQPVEESTPSPAGPAARPRGTWLGLLEKRMTALGAQRLPSTSTVRAYHADGSYVPWEADLLRAICRLHGTWVAVPWCFTFTTVAWLGAGDYRRRLNKLRAEGVPGLCRSQLPPMDALTGFSRAWVGFWSAVAWTNLKVTRMPTTLAYVLPATGPLWWPSVLPLINSFLSIFTR